MNNNVITAVFGALRETKVRPRYRYDRGQVLVLKGIRNLPDFYEVHFANIGGEADATPVIGTAEGVEIPSSYFESAAGILAYIYVHDEATDGTTIYKVTIPIIDRPRPADTEPTQEEADIISQAIVALNENVGRAEESAETAQSAADGAAQAERNAGVSAERAEAAEQAAETSATGASSSAAAAQAAALSAAESESQASAHKDAAMVAADNADAASASASDHASAAQSAAGQAEQYKNTAVAAGNAAQAAATNAGAARTAAEAAQTAAEAAQTAAEGARSAAETARTDAQTYAGQASQSATDAAQSAAGAAQTLGQVRTEGAAQVAAVDAEGQRVLDSIPEDYSQMEDDITDLKSQIDSVIQETSVTVSNPGWLNILFDIMPNDMLAITNTGNKNITFNLRGADNTNLQQFVALKNTTTHVKATVTATRLYGYTEVACTVTVVNTLKKIPQIETKISGLTHYMTFTDVMELGSILFSSNGFVYSSSTSRVRFPEGYTVRLNKGDVIRLTNYTSARYYVGWKKDDTYSSQGWLTSDFVASETGDYAVLITSVPEASESSAAQLASLLVINKYFNYSDYYTSEQTNNLIVETENKTKKINYTTQPGFISADGIPTVDTTDTTSPVYSEKIYVSEGQTLKFVGRFLEQRSAWLAVATYKMDGEFIERSIVIGSVTTTNYNASYTVSGNVGYVILTYRTFDELVLDVCVESTLYNEAKIQLDLHNKVTMALRNVNIHTVNHKGYNSTAPENTLSAFRESYRHGYRYIESDVKLTSDGVPVMIHDETVDRTSNGTGYVSSFTFEQIRQLDFGSWKSVEYAGEKIPSFEEYIALSKNLGLHPYIQMDIPAANTSAIQNCINIVNAYGMRHNVTWISINKDVIALIHQQEPSARIGWIAYGLTVDDTDVESIASLKDDNELFVDCSAINSAGIEACIENDIALEMYTINTVTELNNLDNYVTGITSDTLLAELVLATK